MCAHMQRETSQFLTRGCIHLLVLRSYDSATLQKLQNVVYDCFPEGGMEGVIYIPQEWCIECQPVSLWGTWHTLKSHSCLRYKNPLLFKRCFYLGEGLRAESSKGNCYSPLVQAHINISFTEAALAKGARAFHSAPPKVSSGFGPSLLPVIPAHPACYRSASPQRTYRNQMPGFLQLQPGTE